MKNIVSCPECEHLSEENDISCDLCDALQQDHHPSNSLQKIAMRIHKKLRNVKIFLYIIAGINFLVGIYYAMNETTFNDGIISILVALVFIGCAIWMNRRPLVAVLVAFVCWVLLQLSVVLVDPLLLSRGLFLKIIFFALFIRGIASAREAQKYMKQHEIMKV